MASLNIQQDDHFVFGRSSRSSNVELKAALREAAIRQKILTRWLDLGEPCSTLTGRGRKHEGKRNGRKIATNLRKKAFTHSPGSEKLNPEGREIEHRPLSQGQTSEQEIHKLATRKQNNTSNLKKSDISSPNGEKGKPVEVEQSNKCLAKGVRREFSFAEKSQDVITQDEEQNSPSARSHTSVCVQEMSGALDGVRWDLFERESEQQQQEQLSELLLRLQAQCDSNPGSPTGEQDNLSHPALIRTECIPLRTSNSIRSMNIVEDSDQRPKYEINCRNRNDRAVSPETCSMYTTSGAGERQSDDTMALSDSSRTVSPEYGTQTLGNVLDTISDHNQWGEIADIKSCGSRITESIQHTAFDQQPGPIISNFSRKSLANIWSDQQSDNFECSSDTGDSPKTSANRKLEIASRCNEIKHQASDGGYDATPLNGDRKVSTGLRRQIFGAILKRIFHRRAKVGKDETEQHRIVYPWMQGIPKTDLSIVTTEVDVSGALALSGYHEVEGDCRYRDGSRSRSGLAEIVTHLKSMPYRVPESLQACSQLYGVKRLLGRSQYAEPGRFGSKTDVPRLMDFADKSELRRYLQPDAFIEPYARTCQWVEDSMILPSSSGFDVSSLSGELMPPQFSRHHGSFLSGELTSPLISDRHFACLSELDSQSVLLYELPAYEELPPAMLTISWEDGPITKGKSTAVNRAANGTSTVACPGRHASNTVDIKQEDMWLYTPRSCRACGVFGLLPLHCCTTCQRLRIDLCSDCYGAGHDHCQNQGHTVAEGKTLADFAVAAEPAVTIDNGSITITDIQGAGRAHTSTKSATMEALLTFLSEERSFMREMLELARIGGTQIKDHSIHDLEVTQEFFVSRSESPKTVTEFGIPIRPERSKSFADDNKRRPDYLRNYTWKHPMEDGSTEEGIQSRKFCDDFPSRMSSPFSMNNSGRQKESSREERPVENDVKSLQPITANKESPIDDEAEKPLLRSLSRGQKEDDAEQFGMAMLRKKKDLEAMTKKLEDQEHLFAMREREHVVRIKEMLLEERELQLCSKERVLLNLEKTLRRSEAAEKGQLSLHQIGKPNTADGSLTQVVVPPSSSDNRPTRSDESSNVRPGESSTPTDSMSDAESQFGTPVEPELRNLRATLSTHNRFVVTTRLLRQAIASLFLAKGKGIRYHAGQKRKHNDTSDAVSPAKATVSPTRSRPRKRAGRTSPFKEDTDQSGESETDSRPKRHRKKKGKAQTYRLLACPYTKFNPARYSERNLNLTELDYRRCSGHTLRDIPRLKQHLYRVHQCPELHCPRCYKVFHSRLLLNEHICQKNSCSMAPCPFPEKFGEDQLKELKKRQSGKSDEECWYKIFEILFPGITLPANPYVEDYNVSLARQLAAPDTGNILSQIVIGRLANLSEDVQMLVRRAVEDSLPELWPRMAHTPTASSSSLASEEEFSSPNQSSSGKQTAALAAEGCQHRAQVAPSAALGSITRVQRPLYLSDRDFEDSYVDSGPFGNQTTTNPARSASHSYPYARPAGTIYVPPYNYNFAPSEASPYFGQTDQLNTYSSMHPLPHGPDGSGLYVQIPTISYNTASPASIPTSIPLERSATVRRAPATQSTMAPPPVPAVVDPPMQVQSGSQKSRRSLDSGYESLYTQGSGGGGSSGGGSSSSNPSDPHISSSNVSNWDQAFRVPDNPFTENSTMLPNPQNPPTDSIYEEIDQSWGQFESAFAMPGGFVVD